MSLAPPEAPGPDAGPPAPDRPRRVEIRSARAPRPQHDAWRALGHSWEVERGVRVGTRRVLTVYLAGAECPFTCPFCDLWRHTLPGATPPGALPVQLEEALKATRPLPRDAAIKLYNASNFFETRAVPPEDDARLVELCAPFARVTVESHPKLLGERCTRFAERLPGRLEVAMGLETVHPEAFRLLKDGATLEELERAFRWASHRGLGVRAFVLVGLPGVPARDYAPWAARSAAWALARGADRVSLIPLRSDRGVPARWVAEGSLIPVRLTHLEEALERALRDAGAAGVVEADLWNAADFAACPNCRDRRIARLRRMNLGQRLEPPVSCPCGRA